MSDNIITKLFPDLKVYSKEDLASKNPEELTKIFQEIEGTKKKVDSKVIQLQTQIESREVSLKELEADIKKTFGVESAEDLQALREKAMSEFDDLYTKLQAFLQ